MLRLLVGSVALLSDATYKPVLERKNNIQGFIQLVYGALSGISFMLGIGLILLSIYKFIEYRQNPMAHPLGSVASLLITGLAFFGLSFVPMQTI